MKRWFVLSFLLTAALGSAWHFLYDWCPTPLIGLFAPVNESVWEHLKLLFWPVIPAILILGRRWGRQAVWSGFLWSLLWMPVAMLGVYYLASAGFGIHNVVFDIVLYVLTLAAGFAGAWHLTQSKRAVSWLGTLIMLVGVYGAALVLFSLAAPDFPIFMPPQ